jgi:hypothetical protein
MKLKSYPMISLRNFLGSVVESVVEELVSDEAEKRALLSHGEFGSRQKGLAIDAGSIMVERAHASWRDANITGVLRMDIKAAFSRVVRATLIPAMKANEIDGDLIHWT